MTSAWPVLVLCLLPAAALAVEVRVKPTPGGPRIHVDGVAVPPRMYFGNRGFGGIAIDTEPREHSFRVRPGFEVDGNGTLHFRFGQKPGTIVLRDLTVTDDVTGEEVLPAGSLADEAAFAARWALWPPPERNTVGQVALADGALTVTLTEPTDGGAWPDFHLHTHINLTLRQGRAYTVRVVASADAPRTLVPGVYRVAGGEWQAVDSDLGPFLAQIALARDAGVRFISFPMASGWVEPGQPADWEAVDAVCESIIAVHPTVLLVPRVGTDAPPWYMTQHPDSVMLYEDGSRSRCVSVSDREYRAAACAQLEALSAHLTERFPDHFAGLHPCGQNTGEWFYENTWEAPLSGYEPVTRDAWRRWLADLGDPGAADAEVPTPTERHSHERGFLLDPTVDRRLIEWHRFQQAEMADFVAEQAAAVRRGTLGRKLVVFFYGYHYEFAGVPKGPAAAGHYGLQRILDEADIDILCSPISYLDRGWQGASSCMSPAESINLAGKLWLNEDDTRTYLSGTTDFGGIALPGRVEGQAASRAVLLRNTAQAALRGFGTWWMDLPGEGWFNDKALWDELVRMGPLDRLMLARAARYAPPIALFTHEDSVCHIAGRPTSLTGPLIGASRMAFGRCGASYGQYLLRDAGRATAPLQVMLCAWALSPAERAALAGERPAGTTRVWCWAPGLVGPDGLDPAAMRAVCGFELRPVAPPDGLVTPTPAGRALGLTEPWVCEPSIRPLYSAVAEGDEVLATWSDGTPAVAARRNPGGLDIYCGTPAITSSLVRAWARLAGVHLFSQRDIGLWESDGILSLHVMEDGPLTIDTGTREPVIDLLDGRPVGQGPLVTVPATAGQTLVWRYRQD